MANDVLDVLSTHIEQVRRKLPKLYETSSVLASCIKNTGETTKVSRYLYRIPIELFPGGTFAKYSANGGSPLIGHNLNTTHLTAGYFYSSLGYRLTEEQMDTTQGDNRAIINLFNLEMSRAIPTYQVHDDITLHQDGTGKLTAGCSAASAGASSTMTFATAADYLNIHRLRLGMYVDAWNSAGSTNRGGGVITKINPTTKVVTINANISGLTTGDILALGQMDAYGPSTLASFTSGWPPAPGSQVAAGLGSDSFRHGIEYWNDATAANYVLGVQKSAVPALIPAYVNAASAPASYVHGYKLWSQLQSTREGDDFTTAQGLIGLMHMDQVRNLIDQAVVVANRRDIGSGNQKIGGTIDFLPQNHNYTDSIPFAGVMCKVDKRMRSDRIDFINPQLWGRAVAAELDFWDPTRTGRKVHLGVNTTTGGPKGEIYWWLSSGMDYYCVDPGAQAYIDSLAVPT